MDCGTFRPTARASRSAEAGRSLGDSLAERSNQPNRSREGSEQHAESRTGGQWRSFFCVQSHKIRNGGATYGHGVTPGLCGRVMQDVSAYHLPTAVTWRFMTGNTAPICG